jgi:hypothetical protein
MPVGLYSGTRVTVVLVLRTSFVFTAVSVPCYCVTFLSVLTCVSAMLLWRV